MSVDDLIEDLELETDTGEETEPEPEPEEPHEVPLICGHWISTYEEAGHDYCGICGTLIE